MNVLGEFFFDTKSETGKLLYPESKTEDVVLYCFLDGLYTVATVISKNEAKCSVKVYPLLTVKETHFLWLTVNKIDFHGPIEILFVPEI